MPFQKLTIRPGINVQRTALLNKGGWSNANLVRFREGLPEVYGGWVSFATLPVSGVCRGMHGWVTLTGALSMGAGTNLRLYVLQGGLAYDITPVAQTTTPTGPFTTTNGSAVVTVSDPGLTAPLAVGNYVEISAATAVGGITLAGEYTVASVISPTSYTVVAASTAGSGATGGGTPTIAYLLGIGPSDESAANGWGAGTWGSGTWGTPRSGTSAGNVLPRIWEIDNWGEVMIANPRGGGIYAWLPASGTGVRAALITGAPTVANAVFVSSSVQQIIALGSNPASGGAQDPMLVSWCNSSDYNTWVASSSNNAGSFRLTDGSQIMWGCRAAQQNLIWTDTALYSMQFQAGSLVYGFQQLGTACGLIAPKAAQVTGVRAFWMSGLNFMWYNGTIQVLDCPVRDLVYKNLNIAQAGKIICGINSQFSEVRWDYPSLNATENDSYVIFNYAENHWTVGGNAAGILVARTAWEDITAFGYPTAFDASGNSWYHESGYTAGGSALPWFLQSGEIDIAQGEEMMFSDLMLPDQIMTGGPIAAWVYGQAYSSDTEFSAPAEPFQVTTGTQFIPYRIRARQLSFRFDNSFNAIGVFWRLGAVRVRVARDGRVP